MSYKNILKASNSEQILAVIENLPVDANGFFLNAEQMDSIEATLEQSATSVADLSQQLATATAATAAAEQALATAQQELATAGATIAANSTRIAQLEAENATLQAAPGGAMGGTHTDEDRQHEPGAGVPSYAADDHPLNALADRSFGKPKS